MGLFNRRNNHLFHTKHWASLVGCGNRYATWRWLRRAGVFPKKIEQWRVGEHIKKYHQVKLVLAAASCTKSCSVTCTDTG